MLIPFMCTLTEMGNKTLFSFIHGELSLPAAVHENLAHDRGPPPGHGQDQHRSQILSDILTEVPGHAQLSGGLPTQTR